MRALALLLLAATVFGADINGAWKATFTTPDGQTRENTFTFKAEGEKVTGKLSSAMGDAEIKNGVLKGDVLTFSAVRNFGGNEVTFNYKAKVEGNKMNIKATAADRQVDMTAVKQ
jgi:hypothetical protein